MELIAEGELDKVSRLVGKLLAHGLPSTEFFGRVTSIAFGNREIKGAVSSLLSRGDRIELSLQFGPGASDALATRQMLQSGEHHPLQVGLDDSTVVTSEAAWVTRVGVTVQDNGFGETVRLTAFDWVRSTQQQPDLWATELTQMDSFSVQPANVKILAPWGLSIGHMLFMSCVAKYFFVYAPPDTKSRRRWFLVVSPNPRFDLRQMDADVERLRFVLRQNFELGVLYGFKGQSVVTSARQVTSGVLANAFNTIPVAPCYGSGRFWPAVAFNALCLAELTPSLAETVLRNMQRLCAVRGEKVVDRRSVWSALAIANVVQEASVPNPILSTAKHVIEQIQNERHEEQTDAVVERFYTGLSMPSGREVVTYLVEKGVSLDSAQQEAALAYLAPLFNQQNSSALSFGKLLDLAGTLEWLAVGIVCAAAGYTGPLWRREGGAAFTGDTPEFPSRFVPVALRIESKQLSQTWPDVVVAAVQRSPLTEALQRLANDLERATRGRVLARVVPIPPGRSGVGMRLKIRASSALTVFSTLLEAKMINDLDYEIRVPGWEVRTIRGDGPSAARLCRELANDEGTQERVRDLAYLDAELQAGGEDVD